LALPTAVNRLTTVLPYALRVDLETYLMSIDAAKTEIYAAAGVRASEVPSDEFLLVIGLWRIWTQVDAQRWIVRNSLELAQDYGAGSIQAGSVRLSRGSEEVDGLQKLSRDLRRWLNSKDLEFVIGADDPRAVLQGLQPQRNHAD
jgi:hypothetical protein